MGLADIFYQELNRHRDKSISEKEKKKVVKNALKKTLKKFDFLWNDQLLTGTYKMDETKVLLNQFSEEFLDLAVEIDESLKDEEIVEHLREISKLFKQASHFVPTGSFRERISNQMGQALHRINEINKKLDK